MIVHLLVHDMSGRPVGLKTYFMPLKGSPMILTVTKAVYKNITQVDGKLRDLGGI